jgi:prevent-host-death family protein
MHAWPAQNAKARLSELLDACLAEGPQLVTRRGAEAAVLVPVDEWRRLKVAARPSLKALLLSDEARHELVLPARGAAPRAAAPWLRWGRRALSCWTPRSCPSFVGRDRTAPC